MTINVIYSMDWIELVDWVYINKNEKFLDNKI